MWPNQSIAGVGTRLACVEMEMKGYFEVGGRWRMTPRRRRTAASASGDDALAPSWARWVFLGILAVNCLFPRQIFIRAGPLDLSGYSAVSMFGLGFTSICLMLYPKLRLAWNTCVRRSQGLFVLFGIYTLWCLISDILGDSPVFSFTATVRFVLYVSGNFFTASVFFLDERCRRQSVTLLIFTVPTAVGLGVLEKLQQQTIYQIFHIPLTASNADMGSLDRATTGAYRDGEFRAQANFLHPIVFAQYLAAFGPLLWTKMWRSESVLIRLVAGIGLPAIAVGMWAASARSAIVVLVVAIAARTLPYLRKRVHDIGSLMVIALVPATLVVFFLWIYGQDISQALMGSTSEEQSSTESRLTMIQLGLEALVVSPIFGHGEGMAGSLAGLPVPGGGYTLDSYYLSVLLDFGIVGFGLFVTFFVTLVRRGLFGSICDPIAHDLAAMAIGLFAGFSIVSIYDNLTFVFFSAGYLAATTTAALPNLRSGRVQTPASVRRGLVGLGARANPTRPHSRSEGAS